MDCKLYKFEASCPGHETVRKCKTCGNTAVPGQFFCADCIAKHKASEMHTFGRQSVATRICRYDAYPGGCKNPTCTFDHPSRRVAPTPPPTPSFVSEMPPDYAVVYEDDSDEDADLDNDEDLMYDQLRRNTEAKFSIAPLLEAGKDDDYDADLAKYLASIRP